MASAEGYDNLSIVNTQRTESPRASKALVYARTSGRGSKSTTEQVAIARYRIKERGWRTTYILQDSGKSGGNSDRAGYQQMLSHAANQEFDVLVVWKADRVARSLAEMASLETWLRELGIRFHSCTESIDTTTAQGRFMFGILASAAQLEREMGIERVTDIMSQRAANGAWLHAVAPFGYCLGKNRSLRIHPSESEQIKHVFEVHGQLGSYAETAACLNEEGGRRRGRRWTAGTIQRVIENPICIGHYTHWNQEIHRPNLRIISNKEWQAAVQVRATNPRVGKPASDRLREASINNVFDQYMESLKQL